VITSDNGFLFKTESGWSSGPGLSLTGEDMAAFFVPAGESESARLLSELATMSPKPTGIFSGLSWPQLLGAMEQGFNLARLGQQRQQPTYRQPGSPLPPFDPASWARARARQEQRDREMVTNSKGEMVPVVFPANY